MYGSHFYGIHKVKCRSLLRLLGSDDGSIRINGYRDPAIEGTDATLECSTPNLLLLGPNTVTCMGNGEWEPDPRQVLCVGEYTLTFHC